MKKNFVIFMSVIVLLVSIGLSSVVIGQNREAEKPSENIVNEVEMNQEYKEDSDLENSIEVPVEEVTEKTTEVKKMTQKINVEKNKKDEKNLSETTNLTTKEEQKPENEQEECEDDFVCGGVVVSGGIYMMIGEEVSLFYNEELESPLIEYSSADESVAVIDEFGNIKGVGLGETMVYAVAENGMERHEMEIIVLPGFEMSIMELDNYACIQLTESYLYANIDGILPEGSYIEWTADNDNFDLLVIEEDNVLVVTPKHVGETNITATVYYSDGTILAQESVEIVSNIERHF